MICPSEKLNAITIAPIVKLTISVMTWLLGAYAHNISAMAKHHFRPQASEKYPMIAAPRIEPIVHAAVVIVSDVRQRDPDDTRVVSVQEASQSRGRYQEDKIRGHAVFSLRLDQRLVLNVSAYYKTFETRAHNDHVIRVLLPVPKGNNGSGDDIVGSGPFAGGRGNAVVWVGHINRGRKRSEESDKLRALSTRSTLYITRRP